MAGCDRTISPGRKPVSLNHPSVRVSADRVDSGPVGSIVRVATDPETPTPEQVLVDINEAVGLAPVAIVVVDGQHQIVESSPLADRMFCGPVGSLKGHSLHDLVEPDFRDRHRLLVEEQIDLFARANEAGEALQFRQMAQNRIIKGLTLAGEELQLDIRLGPPTPGFRGAVAAVWDIGQWISEQARRQKAEEAALAAEADARRAQLDLEMEQQRHEMELENARATHMTESKLRVVFGIIGAIISVVAMSAVLVALGALDGDSFTNLALPALTGVTGVGGYLVGERGAPAVAQQSK